MAFHRIVSFIRSVFQPRAASPINARPCVPPHLTVPGQVTFSTSSPSTSRPLRPVQCLPPCRQRPEIKDRVTEWNNLFLC
ncbi:hypothetical protein C2845_PM09G12730 [Panicum miliaceum]|uniref:Uncharacterized protein n=1 Tax=Panicum miliaceum TaxID=4540 RepID=A0A3L6RX95_PANMI|nr:hypothetical protein C2845_PM09G12730 [Panicum miliaceum]